VQVEQTQPALAPSSSHRQLVQALRSKQKTSKGASAYARYFNRPAGRHFAALAYKLRMTPNGVTAVSALCSFSGIGLIGFAPATAGISVLIVLLLVLGYALDSADGQLARLRGGGSFAGEWLDHVVDAVKMASLHLAVLVAWYQGYAESGAWLAVPLLYQLLAVVLFFTIILTDQMRRAHRGSTSTRLAGEGSSSFLYSLGRAADRVRSAVPGIFPVGHPARFLGGLCRLFWNQRVLPSAGITPLVPGDAQLRRG